MCHTIAYLFADAAADDMIEHLKSENGRLQAQVNDLRSEVTSIRQETLEGTYSIS